MKLAAQRNNRGGDASSPEGARSAFAAGCDGRPGVAATLAATGRRRHAYAFTLAEVLAALLFLAIVIPTAVEALHVASLAGEVAARKAAAARVADRVLNESLVTTNWMGGMQSGAVTEGILDFKWKLTSQSWPQDSMQLLTTEVTYSAQGKDYSVKLSTLANLQNGQQPSGTSTVTR
jgi:hypothetical protein